MGFSQRHPPGPRDRTFSGNLAEFRRDMLGFLEKCVQDYGDIVSLRLGTRRIYLLNHPDLVEQVLIAQARNFKKDFSKCQGRTLMGNGLLNSWGDLCFGSGGYANRPSTATVWQTTAA
jgi:cytochrome P450